MKCYKKFDRLEAGIDEAGRGPLFGRVYAAAVILNPYYSNMIMILLKIVKNLIANKLLESEQYVKDNAIDWCVAFKLKKE